MNCPKCGGETRITRSHAVVALQARRRRCVTCAHEFFTEEKLTDANVFRQLRARSMRAYRDRAPSLNPVRASKDPGDPGSSLNDTAAGR